MKSPNNIFDMLFRGFIENTVWFLINAGLYVIRLILCVGMTVLENNITEATS
jgi:hypothetical protein